jgi:hypothetical protein
MALRYRRQRIEFTVGIGGIADMPRARRAAPSDVNDPSEPTGGGYKMRDGT